ncbi:MAG: DNA-processing protein DprA, partial [Nanoarchaeota archaeon]
MIDNISYNLLRLLETSGIGVAKVNSILDLLTERNIQAGSLNPQALKGFLNEKQLVEMMSNLERVNDIWERLTEKGVKTIAMTEKAYPKRLKALLGRKTPPLLMVLGNHELLNKPSVGFCGSRKASDKGLATAWDCADQLAREGINIVSGYAAGADMA